MEPHFNSIEVKLENVLYVPRMKRNLISAVQLAAIGNYVVFSPQVVKVYRDVKILRTPVLDGEK